MLASTALCAGILMGVPGYVPAKLYRLKSGDNFAKIAKLNDLGYERLMDANPTIKPDKARDGLVILIPARLPKGLTITAALNRSEKSKMTLASNKNSAKTGTTPAKPKATSSAYYVRNGDNDWTIAPKFGITPKQLRQMNPRVNWELLRVGQPIRVPLKKAKTATGTKTSTKPKMTLASNATSIKKAVGAYVVKSGDNDWIIAKKFGITPTQLRKLNPGVKWDKLKIGQSLKTPGGSAAASSGAKITSKRVAINRTDVTVRSAPNTTSRRVTTIDRGNVASVVDRKDGWYKLRFSTGLIGWVRGDMLKAISAKEAASTKPRPRMTTASGSRPSRRGSSSSNGGRTVASYGRGAPSSLLGYAQSFMGVRYKWGGTGVSRGGFDCSGFTSHVFAKHGIRIPRTSIEQSKHGASVPKGSLKQGDLVFFKTRGGSRVSHVGIYIGGGKFIHASSGGGKVQVNSLSDSYYSRRYAGARRVSGGKTISVSVAQNDVPTPSKKTTAKKTTTHEASTSQVASVEAPPVTAAPPVAGATTETVKKEEDRPSRVQPGADLTGR